MLGVDERAGALSDREAIEDVLGRCVGLFDSLGQLTDVRMSN